MKIAILSRDGGCFPNVISVGLSSMLNKLNIENKIFHNSIPYLMRLLPLNKQPKRWKNNWHFRIRNKLKYFKDDLLLTKELKFYDIIILSECLPNGLWYNFLDIETLRKKLKKPVLYYCDGPLTSAPIHKKLLLEKGDYDNSRFDFNLFITNRIEIHAEVEEKSQVIGLNIESQIGKETEKKEFFALLDFVHPGYEAYRFQQIEVLKKLNINYLELQGKYSPEAIRNLYKEASIFFLSFPETFGLPIAECLASGTKVFTPYSNWPMAWRLNKDIMPWGPGELPSCFAVYENKNILEKILLREKDNYDLAISPKETKKCFIEHYPDYYYGNLDNLKKALTELKSY